MKRSIGIFDSGYGGLTVLRELTHALPEYDYLYLGDNARAPYGNRSFDTVYRYTLQCVKWFFEQDCPLVVLACNTASAKALRTIQQKDLPQLDAEKRVLGVIRPTTEVIGQYSRSGTIGILATTGTVASDSYALEIKKFFPNLRVVQQACPLLVPLIENQVHHTPGADYFIRTYLQDLLDKAPDMDTLLLACTHYPLIEEQIQKYLPAGISLLSQGPLVAASLSAYLQRHESMAQTLTRTGTRDFFTTDSTTEFDRQAGAFYGRTIHSHHLLLS
jgi:glutamate racemase